MSILGVLTKDRDSELENSGGGIRAGADESGAHLPMVDTEIDLETKQRYDAQARTQRKRISGASAAADDRGMALLMRRRASRVHDAR